MKFLFIGPTLPDAMNKVGPDTGVLPPARQGDIMSALSQGATIIGLVDGYFEYEAPVWHKEILYGLKQGCQILGASSMGALRACECSFYGMKGVGQIYEDYRSGLRVDDGDVALLHGPAEFGYPPITVPLVNVDATLANARAKGAITAEDVEALATNARKIFFKQRTWKRIAEGTTFSGDRINTIRSTFAVDQKREDALALILELNALADIREARPHWTFNTTPTWRNLYGKT